MFPLLSLVAFMVVATGIICSMVVGAKLLRVKSRSPSPLQRMTYECGESPAGMAWVRFHARYYVVALFFVLFDLEAAFLFPWATVARTLGPGGIGGIVSFIGILMVGWVWALKKGGASMAVKLRTLDDTGGFEHPLYNVLMKDLGITVGVAAIDDLLTWGLTNALWIFPMATSCCGIELMATAASRVDIDRMGTIVRGTPRQADVMVIAGTITTKMAPRVKKLWDQMPEPKWAIAMGSCAMTGDFYRNLYSVVPGVDTFMPVDVYVPGCPPNPESLMAGMIRLQELVQAKRRGETVRPVDPELTKITAPSIPRLRDPARPPELSQAQVAACMTATVSQMQPPLHVELTPSTAAEGEHVAPLAAPDFNGLLKELGVAELPKEGPPLVPVERHVELATRLKALGYVQYVSVVASHFLAGIGRKGKDAAEPEHTEVTTVVRSIGNGSKTATWTVRIAPDQPVPTLARLYAGADWQEREQYDLVGVKFAGHPDLRRIMMAEDYPAHPLRKDFAVDSPQAPWR